MEPALKHTPGTIVAFIDIGTNSVRLLVVESSPDLSYRIVTQQKETVRLGEGEFSYPGQNGATHQRLRPEAIQRTVLVCRKFKELAVSYKAEEIVAVATSATRDADNQEEFIEKLRLEAGLDVRVISGREEARLIYLGIASGVNIGNNNACFIDIGGGSTEIIFGNQDQYFHLDSLKLGAIRLMTMFLPGAKDPVSPKVYARIQAHIREVALRSIQKAREFPLDFALGSSGTIENLAEITARQFLKRRRQRDDVLRYDQLKEVINLLCSLPLEERRAVPGINPERADIIIGGAAILDTLMQELRLSEMQISERALRDGMLMDYLTQGEPSGQMSGISIRERSIRQLGRACGFDETHADKVAQLAMQLYDSAIEGGLLAFSRWQRDMLYYAAILHDIGTFLTYTNHHAHTYYLIRNADLLGFNQTEIAIIATLAFYHRKTTPRKKQPEFGSLDKISQQIVTALSVLLRLAESLDRSHAATADDVRLRNDAKKIVLEIYASEDCQLELWGLKNHEKAFHEVFGKELAFRLNKK